MSWTPLAERFDRLPLILAGPILRRTEQHAVTVWLALKEAQMVTLRNLQNIHDPQQGANQQEQPAEPKEALKRLPERGHSFFQRVVEGTEHLGQELAKRSSLAADAIQHLDEWLDLRKASKQIVGYANIGEIGFRWTEKEKDVTQRLWWWHPDNPERPTPATEYRDTLLLPVHDAAPPLP